jgi:hypothetical protein
MPAAPPLSVQSVPLAFAAASVQTAAPLLHTTVPVLHAAPGLVAQASPATQALQTPLPLQTPPGQAVPAARGVPSTQIEEPDEQSITPAKHAAPALVVQADPARHALQVPLPLHTPPAHAVPAALGAPFTQTAAPLVQSTVPSAHGFALPTHD